MCSSLVDVGMSHPTISSSFSWAPALCARGRLARNLMLLGRTHSSTHDNFFWDSESEDEARKSQKEKERKISAHVQFSLRCSLKERGNSGLGGERRERGLGGEMLFRAQSCSSKLVSSEEATSEDRSILICVMRKVFAVRLTPFAERLEHHRVKIGPFFSSGARI